MSLSGVGSAEWYTPQWIVDIAVKLMGGIDLDPCAAPDTPAWNAAPAHYTPKHDGLSYPWHGRAFINPPGGKSRLTQKFWKKMCDEFVADRLTEAVWVSFSLDTLQTSQNHGAFSVTDFPTWIPAKRLHYLNSNGEKTSKAPKPSAITYVTPEEDGLLRLREAVRELAPLGGVSIQS